MGRSTSGLRLVSRNPSHFRNGRWFLLAEAALLIGLGSAGFVSAAMHPHAAPAGAPVLGLALTPWHSALLFGFGVLAVARRSPAPRSDSGDRAQCRVAFVALVIIGAVFAAHHVPGPLGFEPRDIVLHGVLAVASFAVLYWLIPTCSRAQVGFRAGERALGTAQSDIRPRTGPGALKPISS